MVQMVMKAGDKDEQVMELVDTPEFVLVQFCDLIVRKRDIRNPDTHNTLRETVDALKIKSNEEATGIGQFNRYDLKKFIAQIDDLLNQYPPYKLDEDK
jgi:hypothetical protein